LKSHYKWVTCPHLLERLLRDGKRARSNGKLPFAMPEVPEHLYLGVPDGDLFLEERQFGHGGTVSEDLTKALAGLIAHSETQARLGQQLVVLHDKDFSWFARYGLAINARNVLDDKTKTSNNLWYEESIPPDSLFYCLLAERSAGPLDELAKLLKQRPYIQAGGHETVCQGWFAVALLKEAHDGSA